MIGWIKINHNFLLIAFLSVTVFVLATSQEAHATNISITVPSDMTVPATQPDGAIVTFTVTANDDVEGPLTPFCDNISGSVFPVGDTFVTCTATNSVGDSSSGSFTISVIDTGPILTVPSDMTVRATDASGAIVTFTVTAIDAVDGLLIPTCDPPSGSTFPIGATLVTCTVIDGADNSVSGSFTITITNSQSTTVKQNPDKDSFIRSGAKNTNEGANTILMVQKAGQKRTLVHFDLSGAPSNTVSKATLRLYIAYNGGNWGHVNDRIVEVHKLSSNWTEGNGANFIPKGLDEDLEPEKDRGNGPGVTWNCATDSAIQNKKVGCDSKWTGGNFAKKITDDKTISNSMLNTWIEFDVTKDVNSFLSGNSNNFGWIIKKGNENNSGRIGFVSNEGPSSLRPELVLDFS